MFAFSQVEPRTSGAVTDMEVPIDRYLGSAVEQGQDDSIFHNIYKMRELSLAESDPSARVLSPEDANNRYSIPGLKWDQPVKENVAQLLNKRQQAVNDRAFFLSQDNHSLVAGMAGMGAQMTGSLLNPLDLGLLFVPVVGEGSKLVEGASALGKGLISRSAIAEALPKFPRLAESMIQGLSYQALSEGVAISHRAMTGQGQGTLEDLESLGYGALFAAGVHVGMAGALRTFSHLTPEAKMAAASKAMDDFAKGRRVDVTDIVKQDVPLPEPDIPRPMPETSVPEDVAAYAREIGFDISKTPQLGGMRLDGLRPEEIQQLQAVMGHTSDWEFTDHRPDSPTAGFTFYAPEGTSAEELRTMSAPKIQEYLESRASQGPIDETTPIAQEVIDKIRSSGARTRREIQQLLPALDLSSEEAKVLRDRAWKQEAANRIERERATSGADISPDQKAENAALVASGKTISPEDIKGAKISPAAPDIEKIKAEGEARLKELQKQVDMDVLAKGGDKREANRAAAMVENEEGGGSRPMRDPKTGRFMKRGVVTSMEGGTSAGEPDKIITAYHGAREREFGKFEDRPTFFTTSKQSAQFYATGDRGFVYEAKIKANHPASPDDLEAAVKAVQDKIDLSRFGEEKDYFGNPDLFFEDWVYFPEVREELKRRGFDSYVSDVTEGEGGVKEQQTVIPLDNESIQEITHNANDPATGAIKLAADCLTKKIL